MSNCLFLGGMGAGKSTLVEAVHRELPDFTNLYPSIYAVRIPMTLRLSYPDLLLLPKQDYLKLIDEHASIELTDFEREDMDEFGRRLNRRYGETILAEVDLYFSRGPTLLDNVPQVSNIHHLQEHGFLVVGLSCNLATQLDRCWKRRKDIDPDTWEGMAAQIRRTNTYFEVDKTIALADLVYDTDSVRSDDPAVVQEVVNLISEQ